MKYIYSTLSNDQSFTIWGGNLKDPKALPIRERIFVVHGKANVVNKANFVTPKGVVTTVEDGVAAALQELPAFKRFVDRGYIVVESKQTSGDEAAKTMEPKDRSAQLTNDDLKKDGKATTKVTTNAKGKKA